MQSSVSRQRVCRRNWRFAIIERPHRWQHPSLVILMVAGTGIEPVSPDSESGVIAILLTGIESVLSVCALDRIHAGEVTPSRQAVEHRLEPSTSVTTPLTGRNVFHRAPSVGVEPTIRGSQPQSQVRWRGSGHFNVFAQARVGAEPQVYISNQPIIVA